MSDYSRFTPENIGEFPPRAWIDNVRTQPGTTLRDRDGAYRVVWESDPDMSVFKAPPGTYSIKNGRWGVDTNRLYTLWVPPNVTLSVFTGPNYTGQVSYYRGDSEVGADGWGRYFRHEPNMQNRSFRIEYNWSWDTQLDKCAAGITRGPMCGEVAPEGSAQYGSDTRTAANKTLTDARIRAKNMAIFTPNTLASDMCAANPIACGVIQGELLAAHGTPKNIMRGGVFYNVCKRNPQLCDKIKTSYCKLHADLYNANAAVAIATAANIAAMNKVTVQPTNENIAAQTATRDALYIANKGVVDAKAALLAAGYTGSGPDPMCDCINVAQSADYQDFAARAQRVGAVINPPQCQFGRCRSGVDLEDVFVHSEILTRLSRAEFCPAANNIFQEQNVIGDNNILTDNTMNANLTSTPIDSIAASEISDPNSPWYNPLASTNTSGTNNVSNTNDDSTAAWVLGAFLFLVVVVVIAVLIRRMSKKSRMDLDDQRRRDERRRDEH
jgi:hypothetical protein